MMIEFEDREPAPPMPWGERLFMWSIVLAKVLVLAQCTMGLVPA